MNTASAHRSLAERLRSDIFMMRHTGELGSTEEAMPKDLLRSTLAAKIQAAGVALSDAQLDALVHHFPLIDLMPDDAHPNEDRVIEREVSALTALLAHVVPELDQTGLAEQDDPLAGPVATVTPQTNPYAPDPALSDRFDQVAQEALHLLHQFDTFDAHCIPTQFELVEIRRDILAALLRRKFGP